MDGHSLLCQEMYRLGRETKGAISVDRVNLGYGYGFFTILVAKINNTIYVLRREVLEFFTILVAKIKSVFLSF